VTESHIALVALDLDGTLLDSHGRIPPENVEALERALEAGFEIVLATGRRFDFARPVFEQLPGPLTLVLSNGAIIKTREGETLLRHLLPVDVVRSVLAMAPHHRSSAALLFDRPREGQVVFERVEWDHPRHASFFAENRPFIVEVAPLEDALVEDPLQLMFTGGCLEMRALFDTLRSAPHRDRYAVALTEYRQRDFSLVDVIQAGRSKGAALAEWVAHRGFTPAQVMAAGDNLNDLQMLEFAGHPVIMGNAVEELKTRGWRMTATNDEAGVARVLDEILERQGGVTVRKDRSR
jgi:Cof subfamily protein (haloacid dehalogenase superfamily)